MTDLVPLLIVGAGGCGRETAAVVAAANQVRPRFWAVGYLDDDPALEGQVLGGLPVLGPAEAIVDYGDAQVLVTVGNARDFSRRRTLVERLALPAERYATVVHPSASLANRTEVDRGCVVMAGVAATTSVHVGPHVVVMPNAVLTHDDTVGGFATICAGVCLGGGVVVGEGAYLGSRAAVREGVTIGEDALVGMGSVVLDDVPPGEVWVGSPAGRLRRSVDVAGSRPAR